jgi:hypothetical protein
VGLAAQRSLEFAEALAEGAASVGEPFGSEEHERDDQDDDQVGGLEDSGEYGSVLW